MIRATALVLAVLALIPGPPAVAQSDEWGTAKSAIVMISGRLNGEETAGAGVIVGHVTEPDRLYILTTDHVVREQGETAQDVKVRFYFLPGEDFEARVLADRNSVLDLAVLAISDAARQGIPVHAIPQDILGRPDRLRRGSPLFPLGHAQDQKWWMPINPAYFERPDGSSLRFETSLGVLPGQSGGGLFEDCQNLVGLLLLSRPPWGEAVNIEEALQWLKNTGYPVDLRPSPRCNEEAPRPPLIEASEPNSYQDVNVYWEDGTVSQCDVFISFSGGWLCR